MGWFGRRADRPVVAARSASRVPESDVAQTHSCSIWIAKGNDSLSAGDIATAANHYREAIAASPEVAEAHVNLGFAELSLGNREAALSALNRAVVLDSGNADGHYLIGSLMLGGHGPELALRHLQRAAELQPRLTAAWLDLARAWHEVGRHDEAEQMLREQLAMAPDLVELHHFLGNVLAAQKRLPEAVASYRRAIALAPSSADLRSSLAPALLGLGDISAAAEIARSALTLEPGLLVARSNLLLALSADRECSPEDYLAEAMQFGARVEATAPPSNHRARSASPDDGGRLRVGLVSADLRSHPVGYFLAPVLTHWDRSAMDVVAYSNHASHDALTAALRRGVTEWHEVWGLDDDSLARRIEADRIDILIDLSGHTPGNRLAAFARRPAPVQATWLGYWASTGMTSIDYVIADRRSLPERDRAHFVERAAYLPVTRLCFSAPAGGDLIPAPLPPAAKNGYVTFASFQRIAKLDDATLRLWARVLSSTAGRLRLQAAELGDPITRAELMNRLRAAGIADGRVTLMQPTDRLAYLAAHAEVDIILDSFPHTGATTTCEALWMGVPTLTLAGNTVLSRQGASLLAAAGLDDWIACDEHDFVRRAIALAGNVTLLQDLRGALRERVAASPLMDAARYTRDFQALLRSLATKSVLTSH